VREKQSIGDALRAPELARELRLEAFRRLVDRSAELLDGHVKGSQGIGASITTFFRVRGCMKETRIAWRSGRWIPRPGVPYFGSPTIGRPACARCTRIWCERPVIGRTS